MKLYRIKKSNIDRNGRGLYATKDIKEGVTENDIAALISYKFNETLIISPYHYPQPPLHIYTYIDFRRKVKKPQVGTTPVIKYKKTTIAVILQKKHVPMNFETEMFQTTHTARVHSNFLFCLLSIIITMANKKQ